MKKFKESFPDYEMYSNDTYLMNIVSRALLRNISQMLPRILQERKRNSMPTLILADTLKGLCNKISFHTNNEKTRNWGFEYIATDIDEQMCDFEKLKFYKFMDCMQDLAVTEDILYALNEIFEEHDFGYRLTDSHDRFWININPLTNLTSDIDNLIVTTSEICKQTSEHIKQAKHQLTRATELRARKDAIRDCLSAMESLMKRITNSHDIKYADTLIRNNPEKWGQVSIAKDGISLWNMFHKDYKDIRHGDFDISNISYEETIYFIDRILVYVKYISSIATKDTLDINEKLPL